MTATYRLVHFVSDPFLGARVPLAAIVQHEGRISIERVSRLPGPDCLGRTSATAAMRIVLQDLARMDRFDRLPASVGPRAILGEVRSIPDGIARPSEWVKQVLAGVTDAKPGSVRIREARRDARGMLFLRSYQVDRFVQHHYEPHKHGWKHFPELGKVAQYVQGAEELMLLEPMVPARRQWRSDLVQVVERFSAYKFAFAHGVRLDAPARFYAYILSGGRQDDRNEAQEALRAVADQVVDTEKTTEIPGFIDRIRRVGESTAAAF